MTRAACAALVLCGLAAGCDGLDGNYEASVAVLAGQARASVTVAADGDLELWLERSGSEAFGWEHCPVLHAEATVDGEPMEVLNSGGWVPVRGGGPLFGGGGGGYCEAMHYQLLDPPEWLLEVEDVVIEVSDEGGTIAIEVPFIGAPTLGLAEPRALRPGERAEIAILPSARVLDLSSRRLTYGGALAKKAPGHAYSGFSVEDLEPTEIGMAIAVPDGLLDSRGTLSLSRQRAHGWPPSHWPLPVTRCEGILGCTVDKILPGPIELDVSVSSSGEAVQPDPREDHANWSRCWFTGETRGGVELSWMGASSCQWSISAQPSLQVKYSDTYDSFMLRIADFEPEPGARLTALVEVEQTGRAWRHEDCSVVIDRVWTDIPDRISSVVDGTGECTGPAAPHTADEPITIEPFAFRAPAVQPL